MSIVYRRTIPLLITLVFIVLTISEYLLNIAQLKAVGLEAQSWAVLISAFAVGLGVVSLLRYHGLVVIRKTGKLEDRCMSAWLVGVMIIFMFFGLVFGQQDKTFSWIYDNVYGTLSSATYSILALFITSSAFRAFRARNLDAAVLLISAFFVLIGGVPTSPILWSGFPVISQWIMDVPTAAGGRVIVLGAALGLMTLALRIMIGKETGFLGGGGGAGA